MAERRRLFKLPPGRRPLKPMLDASNNGMNVDRLIRNGNRLADCLAGLTALAHLNQPIVPEQYYIRVHILKVPPRDASKLIDRLRGVLADEMKKLEPLIRKERPDGFKAGEINTRFGGSLLP